MANPLRLLGMTRRAPYRCGRCEGRSLLDPRDNTVAAILTLGAVVVSALTWHGHGLFAALVCFGVLYVVAIGGTMWLLMRLRPTKDNE